MLVKQYFPYLHTQTSMCGAHIKAYLYTLIKGSDGVNIISQLIATGVVVCLRTFQQVSCNCGNHSHYCT